MNYINTPETLPQNVHHGIFSSRLYGRDLGYAIYLPADYETSGKAYPVHYSFHGWQGSELSNIAPMEPVYQQGETIFVFPNASPVLEEKEDLPVEDMFFQEFLPYIEKTYRIQSTARSISGFSMGGGTAVWYAVKHTGMFSEAIAYAGTFHHYYHKDFMTAFVPVERAAELYHGMLQAHWESDRNILAWFDKTPKDAFRLNLYIGTKDPLYCDAQVLHMHLQSLQFPHVYRILEGVDHSLKAMISEIKK